MDKIVTAIGERLGFSSLSYPVPRHANTIKYMLGGMTLFCIMAAIVSGILLAQFYNPNPEYAQASVVYIASEVFLGGFMRNFHFWAANVSLILISFHAVRVFVNGSYKKPREMTYLTGIMLLVIMIALFFSGTVLKWDQEALEALAHNDAAMGFIGQAGSFFTSNAGVSVPFLPRLYVMHVSVLMLALFAVLFVHLYLVKKHGISPKSVYGAVARATSGTGSSSFRSHLKTLLGFGLLTLSLIATLAILFPASLGQPGVPGAEVTKPPWIFLPLYALESTFGMTALIWGPAIILLALVALPFIDRGRWVSPRQRKVIITLGALFISALVLLGYYAWKTPVKSHMGVAIPSLLQHIHDAVIPPAAAHGMTKVNPNPINIQLGDRVTVQAEGLEPGSYHIKLSGMHASYEVGPITVGQEHGFTQELNLPISQPDVFRIHLTGPKGQTIYAQHPLAVQATIKPGSNAATAREFRLDKKQSAAEITLIVSFILLLSVAGALLVLGRD